MTGICGVFGDGTRSADRMVADLRWTQSEQTASFSDDHVSVGCVTHPGSERSTPARTAGETLVWVYGDVWSSVRSDGTSTRRSATESVAAFCAREYATHGIDAVAEFNGTFAGVIYDAEANRVSLVTDRLGTHPLYYAHPEPGTWLFSTQVQSVATHPAVNADFDTDSVAEYLATGSVRGTKTPFTGIEALHPASVTTLDLDEGTVESERYWHPQFDPLDRPFSYFVDEFVDRFEAALGDRLTPGTRYGLLLSGGSDSRAVLAGLDDAVDVRTYHTTGWQSRETRTSERVAAVAGRPFESLYRDRDAHERLLELVPPMMNFQGRFCEAHLHEFGDRLRDEVDVLISGLGADTLFRDHAFDVPRVRVGPLGHVELPTIRRVESLEAFIDGIGTDLPAYVDVSKTLSEILHEHVRESDVGEGFTSHGIDCRSMDELVFFDDWFPFSNKSDFFYHALNGLMPHWTPFLDNRLVDLALRLPLKYRTGQNLINAVTARLDRRLAAIPHGTTGVPLTHSFPVEFVWRHANKLRWKFLPTEEAPETHLSHGPWINTDDLARTHEFVPRTLRERSDILEALPFLDHDGAWQCYHDHLDGTDNSFELYTLLSFLEMPAVERMATGDTPVQSLHSDGGWDDSR